MFIFEEFIGYITNFVKQSSEVEYVRDKILEIYENKNNKILLPDLVIVFEMLLQFSDNSNTSIH